MVKKWIIGIGSLFCSVCVSLACVFTFDNKKATAETDVPAYYVTSEESSVQYGSFDLFPEVEGIAATLRSGDKLVLRSVVDLNKLDGTDPLLQVMVVPSTLGVMEATSLNIRIVDAFDPTNYVNVNVKPRKATADVVYSLVNASNGQMPSGLDRGGTKLHVGDWGTWVYGSFAGTPKAAFGANGNIFGVSFDIQTNSVYAYEKMSNQSIFIADLDDDVSFPRKAWKGFTTGEVYLELELDGYSASTAGVLVVDTIAGIDSSTVKDTEGPVIEVDTLGYGSVLPTAVVGEKYSLFDATAYDAYSGECKVEKKVYTNYYSDDKGLIPSYTFFIPQVADTHYVVYTATDGQDNTSTVVLKVDVLQQKNEMSFAFEEYERTCMVGELYTLPTYSVNGGSGAKDVTMTAKIGNTPVEIRYGQVRPVTSGTLEIMYTARDYIGTEYSETISVQVTATDKASFMEEPILPRSFIDGNTYRLPIIHAYNYVNGNGAAIDTVIKVTENGATRALSGNEYTPSVQNSGDAVTVSYVATIDGKETAYSKNIPVYKAYEDNGNLKMDGFFLTDMTKKTTVDDVRFTAETDGYVDFINPVTALGFNTGFYVDKTSKLSAVSVYLIDYANENNVLKFSYVTKNGSTTFYINDGKIGYPVNENILSGKLTSLSYNDNTQQVVADNISGAKITVETNLAGEKFNGFAQRTAYVRFETEGVTGLSTLRLESVCGQYFFNETKDWVAPVIYIDGTYGGEYSINTTATLSRPFAMDVLDGDVGGTFTVKDPSGNIVTDINGKRLENCEFFETQIELKQYGRYLVTFYAVDKTGNATNTFAYTLRVIDEIAPTLTLDGNVAKTVKVGSTVGLPKAVATDNYDGSPVVRIMVIDPLGHTSLVDGKIGKYQLSRVGTYIFCYFTQDEAGNVAFSNQFVTVEE
ncbi:MAG: hypothetical protein IJX87_00205 [Clostridia bacterium]|nr:hypothetical protein [Clostridia bacterium]